MKIVNKTSFEHGAPPGVISAFCRNPIVRVKVRELFWKILVFVLTPKASGYGLILLCILSRSKLLDMPEIQTAKSLVSTE